MGVWLAVNEKLVAIEQAGTDAATLVHARTSPDAAGPWESIEQERLDSVEVALRCQGRYASAQPDGRLEWNRTWIRSWERFTPVQTPAGVAYRSSAFNRYICADLSRPVVTPDWTGCQVTCDRTALGPWELFRHPTGGDGVDGIVGKLRASVHGGGDTLTYSFADDNGTSSFTGTHWFCGATDYHNNPAEAEDVAAQLKAWGFAIIRSFRYLGYDWVNPFGPDVPPPGGSYFGLRGVSPVEAHMERYGNFVEMLAKHGLRTQCTAGHDWNSHDERMRCEDRFWDHMKARGLLPYIDLAEGDNEYVINASMGDSDEQIREYRQLFDLLKSLGGNRPLFACGSGNDESPASVRRSLGEIRRPRSADDDDPHEVLLPQFCDYLDIHTSRDETPNVDETIKRPFSLGYNEGRVGAYGVPIAFSEPRPFPGPAAYTPSDKPGRLFGCYGVGKLWGGLVTHFSGESVRGESRFNGEMRARNLLTAEGIDKVVALLNHVPRTAGESGHVPGGNIWWWQLTDGRIATVCSELWPPSSRGEAIKAPVPLKRFLRIGPNWAAQEFEGEPRSSHLAGHGGALIIGERA